MGTITKLITAAAFVGTLAAASIAFALPTPPGPITTAPGQNKIQCFDGTTDSAQPGWPYGPYGGVCTLNSKGAKGTATLDNSTPIGGGDYSGVYILDASNLNGKLLGEITQLSFNFTGTPTNGSPRLTLPIDKDENGTTDDYLSISAYWCNNGAGLVDAINDPTCTIFVNSDGTNPVGTNWADLVANHPTWKVTNDYPFLVADDPGIWTVGNVKLGKGGK